MLIRVKKHYLILTVTLLIILGFSRFLFLKTYQVLPQASIHLLDDFKVPQNGDKLLVFSPHPDDETLGAGGLIYQSLQGGAKVKVVEVTDGNKHNLGNLRKEELKSALHILGVKDEDIILLNYPDGKLSAQKDIDKKFLDIIRDFQPNYILTTHPADEHPDHAATGKAVKQAISETKLNLQVYNYLVHYHRYPKPSGLHPDEYLLPPPRLISFDKQWFRFNLSSSLEDIKTEAILQYKSQLSFKNPLLRSLLFSFIRKNEIFSK